MRKSVTNVAIALVAIVMLPAQLQAQATPELRRAMQERLEAVWNKDAEAWARLTADEFTLVIPEGTLMNKDDRIAALKGETPERHHALREETTRIYGDTAVHRFIDGSEWVLEAWHRENGVWRVVAAQVNLVTP